MSNINQLVMESINSKCHLAPMDVNFLKSIKDYNEMYYKEHKKNHYYTLICNGKKVAIAGLLLEHNTPFFQIAIHQNYRGQDLLQTCSDLIVDKHNLDILNATIEHNNISSIKAHKKVGFEMYHKQKIDWLIKNKKLEEGQIRMFKKYK